MRTQVEKQEKKKVPKGRAKKRLTYTRRFVNVTLMAISPAPEKQFRAPAYWPRRQFWLPED